MVVITHRPSILRAVDKILVLGEGGARMFGPRDDILPQVRGQLTGAVPARPLPLSEAV